MVTDRPTASLTGQEDWEWNERRERDASDAAKRRCGRTRRADDRDRPPGLRDRDAALRREIRKLEAELERTERRLQCVIERYEHLLAEKNRRLNDASGSPGDGRALPSLSAVFRWRTD